MKRSFQRLLLAAALTGVDTESSGELPSTTILSGPAQSLSENITIINTCTDHETTTESSTENRSPINKRPSTTLKTTNHVEKKKIKTKTKPTTTTKATISSSASASLRRIKKEYKDAVQMGICYDWVKGRLITSATTKRNCADVQLICIGPLATNLRHWHFSFRGVKNSLYESGIYHGVIVLPKDYPATPPRVQLWTPSGRFRPFTDICLSASAYHPESWTPRWTVLSLVHALRLHMLTNPQEIGGITTSAEETLEYARRSLTWRVSWFTGKCQIIVDHGKLLEQGALSLDLDEEEYSDILSTPETESVSLLTQDDELDSREDSIAETTDYLEDKRIVDTITTNSDQHHAVEAMETLEKARVTHPVKHKSQSKNKKKRNKKKESSKLLQTSTPPETQQEQTDRLHGHLFKINTIFATPYRRGLFILLLFWFLSRR